MGCGGRWRPNGAQGCERILNASETGSKTTWTSIRWPASFVGIRRMRRREFIAGLGVAIAWPAIASAQVSTVPVIGYVGAGSFDASREVLAAFHRGLSETGYVEGRNVAVEYRWAEDRL